MKSPLDVHVPLTHRSADDMFTIAIPNNRLGKWFIDPTRETFWVTWTVIYAFEIWLLNYFIGLYLETFGEEGMGAGTFGDMFGAVNSLFSGLAFIGVVYSVLLQRKELDAVREERDETREIFKDQQSNLKRQRFETTFFQLFTAFNDIVDKIVVEQKALFYYNFVADQEDEIEEDTRSGRGAFRLLLTRLQMLYHLQAKSKLIGTYGLPDANGNMFLDRKFIDNDELPWLNVTTYIAAYERLTAEYGAELGRYFRSLYTMLNFVDQQKLPDKEAKFYYKLIRAQLTTHESTLLALNTFSGNSTAKFNDLLFKFGMLKHADMGDELLESFGSILPCEAFGESYSKDIEESLDEHFPEAMPKEYLLERLASELAYDRNLRLWGDVILAVKPITQEMDDSISDHN